MSRRGSDDAGLTITTTCELRARDALLLEQMAAGGLDPDMRRTLVDALQKLYAGAPRKRVDIVVVMRVEAFAILLALFESTGDMLGGAACRECLRSEMIATGWDPTAVHPVAVVDESVGIAIGTVGADGRARTSCALSTDGRTTSRATARFTTDIAHRLLDAREDSGAGE